MSVKFYTFRFLVKRRGLLVIPVCLPTTQRNISKRFTCDDNNFVCMVYGQYGQTQIVTYFSVLEFLMELKLPCEVSAIISHECIIA